MGQGFAVEGFKELNDALQQFPKNVQRRVVAKSIRKGASLVRDRARLNAPVRSGALKRNIKIEQRRRRDRGLVDFRVGVEHGKNASAARRKRGEDPYYWYFQEFGYKAVGRAKARGRKGRQRRRTRARQIHGKHFFIKAFNSTHSSVINLTRNELAKEINRISN